ncbi:hypothetical protein IL252_11400 [Halomicrobium sp. IBSBa]|nr:hypothetical protein [Halomicrobium sp. IBSBa]
MADLRLRHTAAAHYSVRGDLASSSASSSSVAAPTRYGSGRDVELETAVVGPS